MAAALRREPLEVHGDGRQTRDFTYVGTVAAVIADAIRRTVTSPTPVNLAFGTRVSLLELIERIERLLGTDVERRHVDPRPGDVRDSQADQTALRALFPDATAVPLDEGLQATADWFAGRW
jgi:UDP-glucose 4-epimerase